MNPNPSVPARERESTQSMLLPAETMPESVIVDKDIKEVEEWIQSITLKRKALGGFSICPFASHTSYHIEKRSLSDVAPIEGVDVAIFIVGTIALSQMLQRVNELNMIYENYIFLDDHSIEPSYINGVQTNCGKQNLILVQRKQELLEAREKLKITKYYDYWSKEMYDQIVKGQG